MTTPAAGQPVTLTIDAQPVQEMLQQAPRLTYFWLHAYLREIAKRHRLSWLRSKGTRFGRVSEGGRGIVVSRVNEGNVPPRDNEVSYQVTPKEQRQPTAAAAVEALRTLRADIFTGNKVLPVHEFGTDINSDSWMVVPYRTRPGDIHRWKARNPGVKLTTLPSKRDNKLLVYEVQQRRRRGRLPRGWKGPAPTFPKLRLRFVLTKHVDMKPTLRMYSSWDGLQGERDTVFSQFVTRLAQDLQRGKRD